jgi:hypothetical protein
MNMAINRQSAPAQDPILHNDIFPDIPGDSRHWAIGRNGTEHILIQLQDENAQQVRISLDACGARDLRQALVWLTTGLEATPGSAFAGSGDLDQDESWTLVLNRVNRPRSTKNVCP